MLIQPRNLGLRRASCGQRRQRVDGKELDPVGLVAQRRRAPRELTHEKQLVDVKDARRMAVRRVVLVKQGGQLHRFRQVTGLLADLPLHCKGGRIAYIDPAARQRPFAIGALSDQQDFVLIEHCPADIQFRCRIAVVPDPQPFELTRLWGGNVELGGQDGGDELLQAARSARDRSVSREKARPFWAMAWTLRTHCRRCCPPCSSVTGC